MKQDSPDNTILPWSYSQGEAHTLHIPDTQPSSDLTAHSDHSEATARSEAEASAVPDSTVANNEKMPATPSSTIPQTEQDIPHTSPALSPTASSDISHPAADGTSPPTAAPDDALAGIQLTLDFAHLPLTFTSQASEGSPIQDNNLTIRNIAIPASTSANQPEELALLLSGLHRYFAPRCDAGDLEVLSFCLQQFFKSVTRLYEGILPELALCSGRRAAPTHEVRDILTVYCTWTQLHLLSGLLARIESLGHLLVSAVLNMLDALDITCLPRQAASADEMSTEASPTALPSSEQWQQATQQLRERLRNWQQDWRQRLSFAKQFAHLPKLQREQALLDANTEQILAHTRVIFGELLPALRDLRSNNEVGTALLFDLAQQVDRIQLAASAQQEPLLPLLQEHAQCTIA